MAVTITHRLKRVNPLTAAVPKKTRDGCLFCSPFHTLPLFSHLFLPIFSLPKQKADFLSLQILSHTPHRNPPILSLLHHHNNNSLTQNSNNPLWAKNPFSSALDSVLILCASLALSLSLFVADVDSASAFVVTTPRKLQNDELATVRLFQENTPSVVYITNLAVKYVLFCFAHTHGFVFVFFT